MSHDIFISYSIEDKVIADAVVSALENEKIRCWVAPRDIEPGADWGDSITHAIHNCKVILLVFSNSANQSKRVLDEIYYAVSEEKIILPFRIENLDPTGAMRLHLSARHWLDAYQPSWQAHIDPLVESVTANLEQIKIRQPKEPQKALGEKKGFPRLLFWLFIPLVIILSVLGTLWVVNQGKPPAVTPSTAAAALQSTSTEQPQLTDTPAPTEEPTHAPTVAEVPLEATAPVIHEVVLHGYFNDRDFSLDPQIDAHIYMRTIPDNLFLSLTGYDFDRGEVIPEIAESWTTSPDGTLYTFKLRNDIPWVVHPIGGETTQVIDEDGQPRYVTAQDFVAAMHRICDPRVDQSSRRIVYLELVKGCREVNEYDDQENIPNDLFEVIGIRAVAEDELLIELTRSSGYFLTATSSTLFAAVPQWAIDKYGSAWTNPGNIITSGYFVIDSLVMGKSMVWKRNALLPEDAAGNGNVDTIVFRMALENDRAYELWLDKELDYCNLPYDRILSHRAQYPNETSLMAEPLVSTVFFRTNQSPFDNVHARRAFAAAFDRNAYIENLNSPAVPMIHLGPPGNFGAPPIDEIGVGFDLEFARSELALAGYPDCAGFPMIRVQTGGVFFTEELMRIWEENLNCPAGTIQLFANGEFTDNPHIVREAMLGEYPDEHSWVGNLYCESGYDQVDRNCTDIDDLILQAAEEIYPDKRIELYAQIEEAFFGYEGEYPVFPIIVKTFYTAEQPWVNRTQSFMFSETFYNWVLDMDAKLEAKGQ